ncbi:TetR/AcrR family transcriptional regulator [Novosphingobium pentaromativorans]|uniref:HTH tetR-type domain-containing protein n=1 Tax=Novosphingobium pentaromativorans US6-1 TaxID=1088721 RepID=G6EGI8_9SPHN|nr:TetR/AcrR family transcriptional regulator [Novosphingobium pentaromativorans]EHJ59535.1 hypothetical protein NSU_3418 [Novosphingobium pentaromativorans US6-1]
MTVKIARTKKTKKGSVTTTQDAGSSPNRLLAAAERIIIDEGISSLSIRGIAARSGLNSQLVGYYFGGIAELLEALLWANLEPINVQRRQMLSALAQVSPSRAIDEAIDAFLKPMWREAAFCKEVHANVVITEILTNGPADLRSRATQRIRDAYHELAEAFAPLFPQLTHAALLWRICCISGSIIAVATPRLYSPRFFEPVGEELPDPNDEQWYRELFALAKGALLAPSAVDRSAMQ